MIRIFWVLLVATAVYAGWSNPGQAQDIHIGAHVPLGKAWQEQANDHQRLFVKTLNDPPLGGIIDTLPSKRLLTLYGDGKLDCILSGSTRMNVRDVKSKAALPFELHLFTHKDTDLTIPALVTIGRMAVLPPPSVPMLPHKVDWYPLQNLTQGIELLKAGRIDAILAAPSHIRSLSPDHRGDIVDAALPPVLNIKIPLTCHDTKANRAFVAAFDALLARPDAKKQTAQSNSN